MTSLGFYTPSRWRAWKVGRDLTDITRELGYIPLPMGKHRLHKGSWKSEELHADVMRRPPPNDLLDLQWHQDGCDTGADMNCWIIIWASNNPTELLLPDGCVITPNAREIIIFNNATYKHRRPANVPKIRYLFRQRVLLPESCR